MSRLLNRLRKNAKVKASRRLTGVAVQLTEADRATLGRPHDLEFVRPTEIGIWSREEVFLFRDRVYGDMVFNIRTIKDAVLANTIPYALFELPLTQGFHDHLMQDGVETSEDWIHKMDVGKIDTPAIAVDWNDDSNATTTVIDGNHRLIKRFRLGLPSCRIIFTPIQYLRSHMLMGQLGELPPVFVAEFATMPKAR